MEGRGERGLSGRPIRDLPVEFKRASPTRLSCEPSHLLIGAGAVLGLCSHRSGWRGTGRACTERVIVELRASGAGLCWIGGAPSLAPLVLAANALYARPQCSAGTSLAAEVGAHAGRG